MDMKFFRYVFSISVRVIGVIFQCKRLSSAIDARFLCSSSPFEVSAASSAISPGTTWSA
jgi:hypothetical protein